MKTAASQFLGLEAKHTDFDRAAAGFGAAGGAGDAKGADLLEPGRARRGELVDAEIVLLGQRDGPRRPVEKLKPHRLFEPFELHRDGRLRQVEQARGPGHPTTEYGPGQIRDPTPLSARPCQVPDPAK